MNPAIVNKFKFRFFTIFLIIFLHCEYSYSQIVNYKKDYTENIDIPYRFDGKINVFIFTKLGNNKIETTRLLNNLNTLETIGLINFDTYNIHNFSIVNSDSATVCVKKDLILDGNDMVPSFNYDPFYIIVETCKKYDELLSNRPEFRLESSISPVTNKDSEKTQFVNFSDDRIFIKFIKEAVTSSNDSLLKKQIFILQQQHTLDSIEMAKKVAASGSNQFLNVNYLFPILFSLNGFDESNSKYNLESSISFSLDFNYFQAKHKTGAGIEINVCQTNFNLLSKNGLADTIPWALTDSAGDPFKGFIYTGNIEESVSLTTFSVIPHVSINIQPFSPKWFILFSPGIKFSTVLSASYHVTNGNLLHGGLYTQSGTDTVFNDIQSFNTDKKQLNIKSELMSLSLPITLYYKYREKWHFNLGVNYELGLSNILNDELKNNVVSFSQNDYKSLLYSQDKIIINSLSLRIGIAYLF